MNHMALFKSHMVVLFGHSPIFLVDTSLRTFRDACISSAFCSAIACAPSWGQSTKVYLTVAINQAFQPLSAHVQSTARRTNNCKHSRQLKGMTFCRSWRLWRGGCWREQVGGLNINNINEKCQCACQFRVGQHDGRLIGKQGCKCQAE
jgi:hypothetical protein